MKKFKMEHCPHLMPDSNMETVTIMKHPAVGATECILSDNPFISRFEEDTRKWEHIPMIGADVQMDGTAYTWENSEKRNVCYSSPLWEDKPEGVITAMEEMGKVLAKTAVIAIVSTNTMKSLINVFEKEQIKMIDNTVRLGARDIKFKVFDDIEPETLLFNPSMFVEPESSICMLDRGCKSDFNVKSNKKKWMR